VAAKRRIDVYRPETCPKGHAGRIWLHGPYSKWSEAHSKLEYRCNPKGGRRHKFTLTMPPRHPTEDHPHTGETCGNCERPYRHSAEDVLLPLPA
jgi:hypothetical protein